MRCGFQYHKEHIFLECTGLRVCRSCLPTEPDPLTCGGTGMRVTGELPPGWTRPEPDPIEIDPYPLYVDTLYWEAAATDPEEYETQFGMS